MPRAFTPSERAEIKERLIDVAEEHFARFGYRRANVGEIASAAGISKGTLYLFYEAKAELFATMALRLEARMREALLQEMDRPFWSAVERLEAFFRAMLEALVDHPVLWIVVDPDEAVALFRDLSPETSEHLMNEDLSFFGSLLDEWREKGWVRSIDPGVFTGLVRALYAVSLHRDLVGEQEYSVVVDLLVASLAERLAPD
jgi:AcrR family transcriptional regulator